jgi:putative ABC transport system substrate-binding protein
MRRRDILPILAAAAVAWPLVARGQQPARVARIGLLLTGRPGTPERQPFVDAFRQGLGERGYVVGRDIAIEYRFAEGAIERFPRLAQELVGLRVDVIVAANPSAARAARQATATIPIVVAVIGDDPVGDGLVASIARPGGNVTGFTDLSMELVPKRLDLLKQAIPALRRIATLWQPDAQPEPRVAAALEQAEAAARSLDVRLERFAARDAAEIEGAFAAMARGGAEALLILPSSLFFIERRRFAALAARHLLPAMAPAREFAELGCLIAYGSNIASLFRQAAGHVGKILKGAKPADLPVEQPTKFEMVVNLKTAKALGIAIPLPILVQADEVIE